MSECAFILIVHAAFLCLYAVVVVCVCVCVCVCRDHLLHFCGGGVYSFGLLHFCSLGRVV